MKYAPTPPVRSPILFLTVSFEFCDGQYCFKIKPFHINILILRIGSDSLIRVSVVHLKDS